MIRGGARPGPSAHPGRIHRRKTTAIILLAGFSISLCSGCGHKTSGEAKVSAAPNDTGASGLAADDRIAWLLAPCARTDPFLADTGDPAAILVSKLGRGQLDPLRQAKTELVEMGEAALPELRRFCERSLGDPDGAAPLLNALAVLGAMKTHAGHDLLVSGLTQPQDTVRLEAIRGLASHAAPEDYDRLMALVPISSPDVLRALGAALVTADPDRYEDDFVTWLARPREGAAEGPELRPELWAGGPERVSTTRRPETLARFREILSRADGEVRAYLATALAASGDEAALAVVRTDLKDEDPTRRTLTVHALAAVGLTAECASLLWEDRDETLRGLVARAIVELPATQETAGWLRKGMLDRARSVRQVCLAALAHRGDAEARDAGLAMLEGDRSELEYALTALREAWAGDAAFAARAFDVLFKLRTGELQPVRVSGTSLDRAIAQLPLVSAAELLYESARKTSGEIDHLPAHRWYLMQIVNTGPVGRAWLRDRWAEETDPAWRVDIAMAGSSDKDEASRMFLLGVVEDERSVPLEILHAANLLVHQGPTGIVAPRLKRVALRMSDARVRPALNCLLWQWYGDGS